jgi:dTDP-4-dehydrorhamnose reductase
MRIALIGADGQLGSDLLKSLSVHELLPLYYPQFDITQPKEAEKVLEKFDPDVVINTAAFQRVDECEEKIEDAFLFNAAAVRELAMTCLKLESVLVHFSTDYVFDGKKGSPYIEDDLPNPLNVYGVSKLAGEYFVKNILDEYFLVRTCGLYGEAGCWGKGTNFIDSMIKAEEGGKPLKVVHDQCVTPTSTVELSQKVSELIQTSRFGLYHLTNEGQCTWFEFAKEIFFYMGKDVQIAPITSEDYGAPAKRPAFSVLENKKAQDIGLSPFSDWQTALKTYMERKGYAAAKD